jgi:hypothetical protein
MSAGKRLMQREAMMHIVKSVGVMSVAKIMGLLYGCMGVIFIPFFLLVGLVGTLTGQDKMPFAGVLGIAFAIVMPILYGAMGFIMGAIGALLYNLLAKLIGGFELELDFRPSAIAAPYPIIPPPTPGI